MALDSGNAAENVETNSGEEKKDDVTTSQSSGTVETVNTESTQSVDDVMAELEKQRAINKEVIASRDAAKTRLKELEADAQSQLQESEKKVAELTAQYEAAQSKTTELEATLKDVTVSSSLQQALQEAGAVSLKTAMKLIEKDKIEFTEEGKVNTESLEKAIATLKEEHEILFGQVPAKASVQPLRPSEEKSTGGYAEELKKLQQNPRATRADILAIKKKYGRE